MGVQVDFVELPVDEKAKKAVPKSKVTIKGRKENVEEAKKRILNQGEKIADDTTLLVAIPATLDRGSLIGKQGIYLKRLQAKYDVRIDFPKDRKNDEDASDAPRGNPNEITIRGPKKGAEAAKKELVDLIDYEKENGNILAFVVSTKSLPRILGKGGLSINAIKEETNVAVDVQQASDDAPTATISLRGTKTGTQAAKTLILAIAHEVDDETTVTLEIPRHFHTTLIGSGGSNSQSPCRFARNFPDQVFSSPRSHYSMWRTERSTSVGQHRTIPEARRTGRYRQHSRTKSAR